MIADANFTGIDLFDRPSPVECHLLKFVGIYCIILMITSLTFNSALLWVFYAYKEFRTSMNFFIIALTICNLIQICSEFPFVIGSNFSCRLFIVKIIFFSFLKLILIKHL